MTAAIILAAGSSVRYGGPKMLASCGGMPVWLRSCRAFLDHPLVDGVGLVGSPEVLDEARRIEARWLFLAQGGKSRQESARAGLQALPPEASLVLVHDGARPWVSAEVITRVVEAAMRSGAAFPCIPVTDTVKSVRPDSVETLDRSLLRAVQTPQGILRSLYEQAHAEAQGEATDDMALVEALGIRPEPVEGDPGNIKITRPGDELLGGGRRPLMEHRTGIGYDIHRFSGDPERPMWLGGVEFESRPGLEGHSDADALIHAVVDAILGAAGLGDIGQLFPNTDEEWKDARSRVFLEEAGRRVRALGWSVVHVDCSLAAERPKVMKRAAEIRAALASALSIEPDRVSVKATTNEGLGAIGRGEGVAALAVATLAR